MGKAMLNVQFGNGTLTYDDPLPDGRTVSHRVVRLYYPVISAMGWMISDTVTYPGNQIQTNERWITPEERVYFE